VGLARASVPTAAEVGLWVVRDWAGACCTPRRISLYYEGPPKKYISSYARGRTRGKIISYVPTP
jgi:hypothetical protein